MPCSQQQAWLMTVYEFTFLKVTASGLFQSATFARVQVKKKKKRKKWIQDQRNTFHYISYIAKSYLSSQIQF